MPPPSLTAHLLCAWCVPQPVGDKKDMAIVRFVNKESQHQAQQLNNTPFGDRPLHVTAPIAAMSSGIVPANPALAMQMQQIQQMQVWNQWGWGLGVKAF